MDTKGDSTENGRRDAAAERPAPVPIPPRLEAKLTAFQQRLWSVKLAESALIGLIALALSYLALFVLDRFFDTPLWLRIGLLAAAFACPLLGLPLYWHRWVRGQRSLAQVSRLLRRRYPRLGDELLGIVELSEQREGSGSRELVAAAMRQVDERVHGASFDEAVPAARYRLWRRTTVLALGLSALLAGIVTEAAQNTLARWVSPWKSVDRYTFAQLDPFAERLVVPYAESFDIAPRLSDETEWRPARATLRLPGRTLLESQRDGEERYGFEIPPRREPGRLDLRVGDERRRIEVEPLPRPELTELTATVRLPDYLLYASDPVIPVRGGSVSLLAGASVVFEGTTSRPLAEASGTLAAVVEDNRFRTSPSRVGEAATHRFTWRDEHGLVAKSPLDLQVLPVEDQPPELTMRQLGSERIVLETEVVSFDVRASDDFGVRQIGLEWRGERGLPGERTAHVGEKPVAAGEPERRQLEARATFSAAREGLAPQTYHLRAFAEDYLPDRERVFSPTFTLHVLSRADHADWISREFAKWFRNAREVYEREQQMHDTNQALRDLPIEELDKPETRRRLLEQASDESTNARRLEAITRAGRELVGQAAKNDEFEAARLETWAEMMRQLDEIATERMPSVADLLQEASRAEGAAADRGGDEPAESEADEEAALGATAEAEPAAPAPGEDEPAPAEGLAGGGATGDATPSDPGDAPEAEAAEDEPPQPPPASLPSLADREAPLDEPESPDDADAPDSPSPPPPLGLPSTVLAGDPADPESQDWGDEHRAPVEKKLDEALEQQRELLAAFARVADELQQILANLEASTFVKRLKAASRRQSELASSLNRELQGSFGLPRSRIEQRLRDLGDETAAEHETQSDLVYHIQTDLEAYYQRKQDPIFNNVLVQMKDSSVVANLKEVGRDASGNYAGRSISSSEFWADTLDRWAEELVAAAEGAQSGEQDQEQRDGLPPELVLEVMKVLQDQMYLRDETREMESARPGFDADVYASKVRPLELSQEDLYERIDEVVTQITEIPDGAQDYGNEIQLLNLVSDTMRQSRGILARPDTGPETIAAQTEAIELLLQSNRQPPGGGGGDGGDDSSSGGGGSGSSQGKGSALSDIGAAAVGAPSTTDVRGVDQSTGRAGRELPEEFRRGLDQYFNTLDSN